MFKTITDPFLGMGYNTYSALNRSTAGFYENLDTMARWLESQGVGKREGLFKNLADIASKNADHWKEEAEKKGINFLGEMISELAGGAIPGITDFALKVASGFSIPAIVGVQQAKEHDTDPFIGGLVEAAKTKTLDSVFKMSASFNKYLQSLVMGTTFGVQEAVEAPEGQKIKGFAKGAGMGIGLSLMSPSGTWGIKDIYPEVGTSVPEIREELAAMERPKVKEEKKWYHGTSKDFVEFDPSQSTPGNLVGKGIYFTDDPEIASSYAVTHGAEAPNVRVNTLKYSNPFDLEAMKRDIPSDIRDKAIEILKDKVETMSWSQVEESLLKDMWTKIDAGKNPISYLSGEDIGQLARETGYDAILYKGGKVTGGKEHNVTVLFDKSQIESGFKEPSTVGAAAKGTITGPPDIVQLSETLSQLPKESTLKSVLT